MTRALMAIGAALLVTTMFLGLSGCASQRHAEVAILEGTNAAIVSAATDINAIQAREEAACDAGTRELRDACVTRARRWNFALESYDAWRVAWAALKAAWNGDGDDEVVAKAQAALESARAQFWLAKIAAETGGSR